jgi:hypothetical protein
MEGTRERRQPISIPHPSVRVERDLSDASVVVKEQNDALGRARSVHHSAAPQPYTLTAFWSPRGMWLECATPIAPLLEKMRFGRSKCGKKAVGRGPIRGGWPLQKHWSVLHHEMRAHIFAASLSRLCRRCSTRSDFLKAWQVFWDRPKAGPDMLFRNSPYRASPPNVPTIDTVPVKAIATLGTVS